MSHHHHHHSHNHSHSSSSANPTTSNLLGGLDFSSALKNVNFPSLASSLIGSVDIGQLFGVLSGITSSPLKNTVTPQQFASPIMKKDASSSDTSSDNEKEIDVEDVEEVVESQATTSSDSKNPSENVTPQQNSYQDLKFDPEKLSGMLNNLVNMLNSQPKS